MSEMPPADMADAAKPSGALRSPGFLGRRFRVGGWLVDSECNRLSRADEATEPIRLEAKVMAVLVYLIHRQGQLVLREDLEADLWPDTIVGYDALTRCIAKLRKVLGDDSREPRIIETIPKRGYRLLAEVNAGPGEPSGIANGTRFAGPLSTGWRLRPEHAHGLGVAIIAGLGLSVWAAFSWFGPSTPAVAALPSTPATALHEAQAVGAGPRIAVESFRNLSDDSEQDYFSAGLTADITTALAKLSGLSVVEAPTEEGNRGKTLVDYFLRGSVRRNGPSLRVNVHLVEASTDSYLWSERYDRQLLGVFDVQDEVTRRIVDSLSIQLTADELRRESERFTTSLQAYDDFLRGQAHYSARTPLGNKQAREYFRRAIHQDRVFARAYSATALTYVAAYRRDWTDEPTNALDEALSFAKQGVALDNGLPHALWALGYVHLFRQEFELAVQAADKAVALDPNFADSYLISAMARMRAGAAVEALPLILKAMRLNRHYPAAYASVLGQAYFLMGDYPGAVGSMRDAIERNRAMIVPHIILVAALRRTDRLDQAEWAAARLSSVAEEFSAGDLQRLLQVYSTAFIDAVARDLRHVGLLQ